MLTVSADHPDGALPPQARAHRGAPLRWRLVLLVVASVVPLLGFALGYQYVEYRTDIAATGDQILTLARSMTQVVDALLQARISALETLATSSALEPTTSIAFALVRPRSRTSTRVRTFCCSGKTART